MSLGVIPGGDLGTRATIGMMRSLARRGAQDLAVRETAIRVLQASGARGRDAMAELGALHRFVRDEIRFTGDIRGIETLQSPRYTLSVRAGDCDDKATLLVSMARAVGIGADLGFRTVAANPLRPRSFSHVFVIAVVGGKQIALDPTYQDTPMGWQVPAPSRVGDWRV